ncbi:hypothetical protein BYT27DRAFT_7188336 [Phlegmacium glaucopus]|nr:hypothetical protein BYT27DRAFT_7188336 [Phlegmacium glaucopus]
MPQRNVFGYLTGTKAPSPYVQLRALLHNNNVYQLVKASVTRLTQEYIDLNDIASKQQQGLDNIKAELKEQYPHIFATGEGDKRLYFAIRLVFHVHGMRRYLSKQNQPNASVPCKRITRSKRKNQQRQVGTPELFSNSIQVKELESGSKHEDLVEDLGLSQSNKCLIDTMPEVTSTPSSSTKYHPLQYPAIYDFLEASVPPMTHLMDSFIDFGCINADFLRAISSWSCEGIRQVLDQLPGRDGRNLTEMEKLVLQNHFKEYSK